MLTIQSEASARPQQSIEVEGMDMQVRCGCMTLVIRTHLGHFVSIYLQQGSVYTLSAMQARRASLCNKVYDMAYIQ